MRSPHDSSSPDAAEAGEAPPLTAADVRKVARLARLAIGDEASEIERLRGELVAVLGHIGRIRGVDCEGVEPMTRPFDASNRLEEDMPGPTIPVATITAAAPASEGPFIAVPKVLADAS
jgi:aspartyl-tRNA(Asn)/glutamyl-tRNA(Gln) amidotransferase subunit C